MTQLRVRGCTRTVVRADTAARLPWVQIPALLVKIREQRLARIKLPLRRAVLLRRNVGRQNIFTKEKVSERGEEVKLVSQRTLACFIRNTKRDVHHQHHHLPRRSWATQRSAHEPIFCTAGASRGHFRALCHRRRAPCFSASSHPPGLLLCVSCWLVVLHVSV